MRNRARFGRAHARPPAVLAPFQGRQRSGSAFSRARVRAIIERLEARSGKTDVLERHLAFEQAISGSPLVTGNRVSLLENGAETYRAMFAAIEGATHNINLETYIFDGDQIGNEFANAADRETATGRAGQYNLRRLRFGAYATQLLQSDAIERNPAGRVRPDQSVCRGISTGLRCIAIIVS